MASIPIAYLDNFRAVVAYLSPYNAGQLLPTCGKARNYFDLSSLRPAHMARQWSPVTAQHTYPVSRQHATTTFGFLGLTRPSYSETYPVLNTPLVGLSTPTPSIGGRPVNPFLELYTSPPYGEPRLPLMHLHLSSASLIIGLSQ